MGTYGVTHVKKDGKIIPLSDSYDGYFSGGMGQANIYTIKHMNDSLLDKLFSKFTAHLVESDGDSEHDTLSSRQIEEAIFNFSKETSVNEEAKQWFEKVLDEDIRTSVTGVGPLLYLNYYNHYGRDYDYCDYLLDLDNKTYHIRGCPVLFSTIRQLSCLQIKLLNEYLDDSACKDLGFKKCLHDLLAEYDELVNDEQKQVVKKVEEFFKLLANIDEKTLGIYFSKKEEQYEARKASHYTPKVDIEEIIEDDTIRSYGVRTANDLTPIQMRKILLWCNKLTSIVPEAHVLLKNAMWGMAEDLQSGSISLYSPLSHDKIQNKCYEETMHIIENDFKIHLNMMSTAGSIYKYAHEVSNDDKNNENEFGGFFGTPIIEQCSFSVEKIKKDSPDTLNIMHPWLAYHTPWLEVRDELIKGDKTISSPLIWLYMALLNQDKEAFNKVITEAMAQFDSVDVDNKKRISTTILTSLNDGIHVQKLITTLVQSLSINPPLETKDFIQFLQKEQFFVRFKNYMNNSEKFTYLDD